MGEHFCLHTLSKAHPQKNVIIFLQMPVPTTGQCENIPRTFSTQEIPPPPSTDGGLVSQQQVPVYVTSAPWSGPMARKWTCCDSPICTRTRWLSSNGELWLSGSSIRAREPGFESYVVMSNQWQGQSVHSDTWMNIWLQTVVDACTVSLCASTAKWLNDSHKYGMVFEWPGLPGSRVRL